MSRWYVRVMDPDNWFSHLPIICLIHGRIVDERSRELNCV